MTENTPMSREDDICVGADSIDPPWVDTEEELRDYQESMVPIAEYDRLHAEFNRLAARLAAVETEIEGKVLDAVSAMFPDFDFGGCYDLADLLNHATGRAGNLRAERDEAREVLEGSHARGYREGVREEMARSTALRAERDEARQALREIADTARGSSATIAIIIEHRARAALPVAARPETDAR